MNNKINIKIISNHSVCSQIITGFYILKQYGYNIHFENYINNQDYDKYRLPVIEVSYKGKIIVYDLLDGYINIEAIEWYLSKADYYFKSSYNFEGNKLIKESLRHKIHPLGFRYYLTYLNNPINENWIKTLVKLITGKTPNLFFNKKYYEYEPHKCEKDIKFVYWARLWEYQHGLSEKEYEERNCINKTRINMIKQFKKYYPDNFVGGLGLTKTAIEKYSELLAPKAFEDKGRYIKIAKKIDIGIATSGLHNSFGWKMGEYISSSKAIITEKFINQIPGNFENKKNFYEFKTCEECCEIINYLLKNPDLIYQMKIENYKYYNEYLHPKKIIENTLKIVDDNIIKGK